VLGEVCISLALILINRTRQAANLHARTFQAKLKYGNCDRKLSLPGILLIPGIPRFQEDCGKALLCKHRQMRSRCQENDSEEFLNRPCIQSESAFACNRLSLFLHRFTSRYSFYFEIFEFALQAL
jgi:hypothetical protein